MSESLLLPASKGSKGALADWALFLDFDGTLVDIADEPEAVRVDPGLAPILARLRDRLGGALTIVTGRPIAAIDRFLAPQVFDAAGLHGAEHRLQGRLTACAPESHPRLRRAVTTLRERLAAPGLLVEDKGCSVAIHWRLAPALEELASRAVEDIARDLGEDYRLQRGKAVAEILPAGAAKGAIIGRFLDEAPYRDRRPVYVGDDLTDEGGFEAVNARGGLSIKIGGGPTRARARIPSPAALLQTLRRWAEDGRAEPEEVLAS